MPGDMTYGSPSGKFIDKGSGGGGGGAVFAGNNTTTRGGAGGAGGGYVIINSSYIYIGESGDIICSGEDGEDSSDNASAGGGGAGGGIMLLAEKGSIDLVGELKAKGGDGGRGDSFGGGGGGGRIKIYYHDNFNNGTLEVYAGHGSRDGEDGTIHVERVNKLPTTSLVSPENGRIVLDKPAFSWRGSDFEDDEITYLLQVKLQGDDWSDLLVSHSAGVNESSWQMPEALSSPLKDGRTYVWRVRGSDGTGWGAWSKVRRFKVDSEPPVLSGLPDAASALTNTGKIEWAWAKASDPISGVKGYNVSLFEITDGGSGEEKIKEVFTTVNRYRYNSSDHGSEYGIRVMPVDNMDNGGAWTDLGEIVLVDLQPPIITPPSPDSSHSSSGFMKWNWGLGNGTGTDISYYIFSIGTFPGGADVYADVTVTTTTFTSPEPQPEGKYYGKLRAADKAGNICDWKFDLTGVVVDKTPPGSVLVYPADGQKNVPTNTKITLLFSELLPEETITKNLLFRNAEGEGVPFEIESEGPTAILIPVEALEKNTTYEITLSEDLSDVAGNDMGEDIRWSFTTSAVQEQRERPPSAFYVSEVRPANNTRDISNDTSVTISFSADIAPETLRGAVLLYRNDTVVPTEVKKKDDRTVVLDPAGALRDGTAYALKILPVIESAEGKALDRYYLYRFTTLNRSDERPGGGGEDDDDAPGGENVSGKDSDEAAEDRGGGYTVFGLPTEGRIWFQVSAILLFLVFFLLLIIIARWRSARKAAAAGPPVGEGSEEAVPGHPGSSAVDGGTHFYPRGQEQYSIPSAPSAGSWNTTDSEYIGRRGRGYETGSSEGYEVRETYPEETGGEAEPVRTEALPEYGAQAGGRYFLPGASGAGEAYEASEALEGWSGGKGEEEGKKDLSVTIEERAVSCKICLGVIKKGLVVANCVCGQQYHTNCFKRVKECPKCGHRLDPEGLTNKLKRRKTIEVLLGPSNRELGNYLAERELTKENLPPKVYSLLVEKIREQQRRLETKVKEGAEEGTIKSGGERVGREEGMSDGVGRGLGKKGDQGIDALLEDYWRDLTGAEGVGAAIARSERKRREKRRKRSKPEDESWKKDLKNMFSAKLKERKMIAGIGRAADADRRRDGKAKAVGRKVAGTSPKRKGRKVGEKGGKEGRSKDKSVKEEAEGRSKDKSVKEVEGEERNAEIGEAGEVELETDDLDEELTGEDAEEEEDEGLTDVDEEDDVEVWGGEEVGMEKEDRGADDSGWGEKEKDDSDGEEQTDDDVEVWGGEEEGME